MTAVTEPDAGAVAAYWAEFAAARGVAGEPDDVFGFGDSAEMLDELSALVLVGTKRATAGSLIDYQAEGLEARAGDHCVIVRGDGTPVAVIRATEVRIGALSSVDDAFAWDEGEGDRSRDYWVAAHLAFFTRTFATSGHAPDADPQVVFQRFAVVWPPEAADPHA